MKCKDCINAEWKLTQSGRIKSKVYGECSKRHELKAMYSHKETAPCICVTPAHINVIRPNYDASHCPLFQAKSK